MSHKRLNLLQWLNDTNANTRDRLLALIYLAVTAERSSVLVQILGSRLNTETHTEHRPMTAELD